MSHEFRLLYRDSDLVVIDKPAGFFTHQSEDVSNGAANPRFFVPDRLNCMVLLRRQLGQWVYPVHRLDRGTSGALAFALSSETARNISGQFANRAVKKTYVLVARGFWPEDTVNVQKEIEGQPAETDFQCAARVELPVPVGRYETARYSIVFASPVTGRQHQIRKHCKMLRHPIVGDRTYGDRDHNRFFHEKIGAEGLMLKAVRLQFKHPVSGEFVSVRSNYNKHWHRTFEAFGICPAVT